MPSFMPSSPPGSPTDTDGTAVNDAAINDGQPNDRTPLLNSQSTQTSHTVTQPPPDDSLKTFLVDPHHTPGIHSDKLYIKCLAHMWHTVKLTIASSYVNILLPCVIVGIIAGHQEWDPTAVFLWNFFGIIPLASVLSFATEEISVKLGETLGGLLNATFGNAVELIVSIVALKDGQLEVVQASMLGSILSNLLLVLGMCFLFGGLRNMRDSSGRGREQTFATATAQTTCSLMALASGSMILPATLYGVLDQNIDKNNKEAEKKMAESVLFLSRGTAIILLLLYVLYLIFQLRTHKNLFDAEAQKASANGSGENGSAGPAKEEEEESMNPWAAGSVLIATTIIVAICAEYLVGSIDSIVESAKISKTFIGLILIPIVGNAAEHVTAVVVAWRDKMDLAMGVAIGSSIQIALLVTPFLVILGWAVLDQPLTLRFETFETVAFAVSVLVVTYTVQDGASNYLEGAMLLGLYVIIALAFWAWPTEAMSGGVSTGVSAGVSTVMKMVR